MKTEIHKIFLKTAQTRKRTPRSNLSIAINPALHEKIVPASLTEAIFADTVQPEELQELAQAESCNKKSFLNP